MSRKSRKNGKTIKSGANTDSVSNHSKKLNNKIKKLTKRLDDFEDKQEEITRITNFLQDEIETIQEDLPEGQVRQDLSALFGVLKQIAAMNDVNVPFDMRDGTAINLS